MLVHYIVIITQTGPVCCLSLLYNSVFTNKKYAIIPSLTASYHDNQVSRYQMSNHSWDLLHQEMMEVVIKTTEL